MTRVILLLDELILVFITNFNLYYHWVRLEGTFRSRLKKWKEEGQTYIKPHDSTNKCQLKSVTSCTL